MLKRLNVEGNTTGKSIIRVMTVLILTWFFFAMIAFTNSQAQTGTLDPPTATPTPHGCWIWDGPHGILQPCDELPPRPLCWDGSNPGQEMCPPRPTPTPGTGSLPITRSVGITPTPTPYLIDADNTITGTG
jgi:hypothetical protein